MLQIKKLLVAIVGLLLSTSAFAHDFEVNGIYYKYLDKTAKTVVVTYKGSYSNSYSNEYTGSVTIPSSVTYNSTTYSVTLIGGDAFYNCDGLTSVTIPNSVTSIGYYAFYGCYGLTEVNISDLSAWCKIDFENSNANPLSYAKKLKLNGAEIKDLVIPDDITEIKNYAFYGCTSVTSVTIPNSVTSIGEEAFYYCSGLTSIVVANGNSVYDSRNNCNAIIETSTNKLIIGCKNTIISDSVTDIGDYAFKSCTGLTSITIPNSVTSIGDYAFYYCTGLTEVNIPNSVTSIGAGAFSNCSGLTKVNIGNSVTSIGDYAFYDCTNLKTVINLSNLTFSKGSSGYGYLAYYAYRVINDPNTSIVEDFVFYKTNNKNRLAAYLGNATNLILPTDFNGENYVISEYAFYGCTSLSSITIPISVTSIGNEAFYGCSGLTSITIPNSVTSIGDEAFYGCSNIHSLTIGSGISSISSNTFSVKPKKTIWLTNTPPSGSSYASGTVNYVANEQYSSLSNVVVYPYLSSMFEVDGVKYVPVSPSERTCDAIDCSYNSTDSIINIGNTVSFKGVAMSVKDIKPYTCYGNDYINDCLINFNGNIGEYAFNGCSAIEKATINAKSIAESAFSNCSVIETITLGTELETIGNSAFNSCSKLNEVIIPNSVTSLGESAFYGCSSLASATIGNAVESIEDFAFSFCSSLPSIEIPKNVTSIGDYAFYDCSKLNDIIIEDRDTVLTLGSNGSSPIFSDCPLDSVYIGGDISYKTTSKYGYSPFYNNKTLRAVTITDKETEISDNEFYGCANLKSVSIGDGVESIGNWAFSGCSSLETFAFGASMKTIGEEAFSDCTALVKLHSKAKTPPACGNQALDDINKWTCELYVPEASISDYQAADQWKEFFFIVTGVESVKADNNAVEVARYDIHGRLLSEPTKGINIIKYSDGSTRKEIVK